MVEQPPHLRQQHYVRAIETFKEPVQPTLQPQPVPGAPTHTVPGATTHTPPPLRDTTEPPDKFHFFWDSSSIFSQWYRCDINYDGFIYNCAEQVMMAKKAALFGDTATELRIRAVSDPAVQKALGRTVTGFDQECWERHRYDIVFTANRHKFIQNPDLRRALVEQANCTLPTPAYTTSFGESATQPTTHSPATHRVGEEGICWAEF